MQTSMAQNVPTLAMPTTFHRGKPSYSLDVDQFEPPLKPQDPAKPAV
jgi:hypothetical protein